MIKDPFISTQSVITEINVLGGVVFETVVKREKYSTVLSEIKSVRSVEEIIN